LYDIIQVRWTVTEYEHPSGEAPVLSFLQTLTDDAKTEAVALVRIIAERGNALRAPLSKALGSGLFELRGRTSGVRIFYTLKPGRVIVLLDGIVKKRGDIPPAVLARVRRFRREVMS
jgi:phage-related protein